MINEFKRLIENACSIETNIAKVLLSPNVYIDNVEVFQQTWPSTALGFPTFGGDAITKAFTTVVHIKSKEPIKVKIDNNEISIDEYYVVFFDGRWVYTVYSPTKRFFNDLKKHQMADYNKAEKLY